MGAYGTDPSSSHKVVDVYAATVTADGNSSELDLSNYDNGFVTLLVHVSTPTTSAGATVAMKLQHATATGGTFADVTGGSFGTIDDSDSGTYAKTYVGRVKVNGVRNFLRVNFDETGTFSGDIAVIAVITSANAASDASATYDFTV